MRNLFLTIALLFSAVTLFSQDLKEKKDFDILPAHINAYHQPIIEMEVNGKKAFFLYDTGASVTMINYYVLNDYMIGLSANTNNVNGLGGDNSITHMTKGVGINLSRRKSIYVEYGIYSKDLIRITNQLSKGLDEKKVVGILGMDIIKQLGISYNAVDNTFVVYGRKGNKNRTSLVANHFIQQNEK